MTISESSSSATTMLAGSWGRMDRPVVYDFDESGVPGSADVGWRQRAPEHRVRRVLGYQDRGSTYCRPGNRRCANRTLLFTAYTVPGCEADQPGRCQNDCPVPTAEVA
jgi:hypothetical protein